MPAPAIDVPREKIEAFCRKWKVRELALFGSVLREDFRPDSDVDVLVTFEEGARRSYWEWADMLEDLRTIFGRNVDLVPRGALKNPFRRSEILRTARTIYAA
ncbi:MAG: nucleotidyltransferase domain-containing protein [Candidatus Methylomirabilis sp.]|nr:nucleotidyltransferase domain-containing protein [Deltaproteobacteria bacterium]